MSSGLCDADAKALPFQPGFSCGNTDSLPCGRARLVATCHRHVAKSRLSNPPSPTTKKPDLSVWSFILPIQTIALLPRIRFSAEKPRPGKQSTGLFAWTGLSNPSSIQKVQHRMVLDFLWWGRTDSNHRSDTQQIYSLSPLATRELPHIPLFCCLMEPVDGLEPPTY